jgi:hypothetical protein
MFQTAHPLIGMVHLAPLAGSPNYKGNDEQIIASALSDAKAIADAGFDAIMMENFGDSPFCPDQVPPITITLMTKIAVEITRSVNIPLGINVLRNDVTSALAIAKAANAEFVRVNILSGARLTDQGVITGKAYEVLRLRDAWQCNAKILADVNVKHSAPLAPMDLVQETKDLSLRAGADGIIVSGSGTGIGVDLNELKTVVEATEKPVFIGSGATASNIRSLLQHAHGVIVGTALKKSMAEPVDIERAKLIVESAQKKGD